MANMELSPAERFFYTSEGKSPACRKLGCQERNVKHPTPTWHVYFLHARVFKCGDLWNGISAAEQTAKPPLEQVAERLIFDIVLQ